MDQKFFLSVPSKNILENNIFHKVFFGQLKDLINIQTLKMI